MGEVRYKVSRAARSVLAAQYAGTIALAMVLFGGAQLVTGDLAYSVRDTLPLVLAYVWAVYLVAGGALTLYALARQLRRVEALGLRVLATASAVYSACIVVVGTSSSHPGFTWLNVSLSAALWLTVALGHGVRAYYVSKETRG